MKIIKKYTIIGEVELKAPKKDNLAVIKKNGKVVEFIYTCPCGHVEHFIVD